MTQEQQGKCASCAGVDGRHERSCPQYRAALRAAREEQRRRQANDMYEVHPEILGAGIDFEAVKKTR